MSEQVSTAVTQGSDTSVRMSITVDVDVDRAFAAFTDVGGWWNPDHHIGAAEYATAAIEPREGGRWYEKGVDGSECDWGRVIAWEPPRRVVLAWQITEEWKYDPNLVTEVEVTFTAEGASRTRVDLEHRNLDRLGAAAAQLRGGWPGLLELFAGRTKASD